MVESSSTHRGRGVMFAAAIAIAVVACLPDIAAGSTGTPGSPGADKVIPFWVWPVTLFVGTFILGIISVLSGIGGGVLYVPLVSSFCPFHLDFVRCSGLLIALSGSLAAAPSLLRKGLADIRLAMPVALIASISSVIGAVVGLALPAEAVHIALGAAILGVSMLMLLSRRSDYPRVDRADRLSSLLGIYGMYHERSSGHTVQWHLHRTPAGLAAFVLVGFMAGMFGMGAGWANVPVLNLIMGAPLKLSVGTSVFLISATNTSAAWVYIHSGAALPILVVPSIVGMMLGSRVGVKLLSGMRPKALRYIVIGLMFVAGARSLLKGMGI